MEEMNMSYDKKGDTLDISLGKPIKAISKEIEEDLFVRIDPTTKKIVGFMVLNFEKRFERKEVEKIPVEAMFSLKEEIASWIWRWYFLTNTKT